MESPLSFDLKRGCLFIPDICSLVDTGSALAIILAPLAAGLLYNYKLETVYIVSLVALAITITLYVLLSTKNAKLS